MDSAASLFLNDCELVDYPVKTEGRPKRFYLFKGNEIVSTQIKTTRPWEYQLAAVVYRMSARGGSFLEVGANIGTDTVLASDFFKQCYAFEPLPQNVELLRRNLELNQVRNVKIFQSAVSNQCGTSRLYAPSGNNCGNASLRPVQKDAQENYMQVETVTLDTALPDVTDVTYLHIDAEGHDIKVLQGARQFIMRQSARPCIRFEFQPMAMREHGSDVSELLDFMQEFGYLPCINAQNYMAPISPVVLTEMFRLWTNSRGWIDVYLAQARP